MSAYKLWEQIVERAQGNGYEVHSVPLTKKQPIWYRVTASGKELIISQATDNSPSSILKMPRAITLNEFVRI